METKKGEFANEKEKILWITLLCSGRTVEGWVDWITTMVDQESPEAPKTGLETLVYLKIYFGHPNEETTAQHQLDALTQTKRVDDYVIAFQSIAYKTGHAEKELKHRFVTGLSDEIRDKCYNSTPVPESLGDWITKAYSLQTAQDIKGIYS